MANKRTKSIRAEAYGYKKKTGNCLNTSALRKASGKKPWQGAGKIRRDIPDEA